MARGTLDGRVALVTGAGRRLGRAFAEGLLHQGAAVVVHYGRSAEGATEVVDRAREAGQRAVALEADLSSIEQSAGLVERARQELGEVDILVNSAAIFEPVGPAEMTVESWERHLKINLSAPTMLSQAFASQKLEGGGTIVNILDWRARRPGADHFPYTISKAGLAAVTESLAQALAPSIRVNGLALGPVLAPADGGDGSPLARVPAGRWAETGEAVEALLFLVGGPGYVTGEILHLDGGRHLV